MKKILLLMLILILSSCTPTIEKTDSNYNPPTIDNPNNYTIPLDPTKPEIPKTEIEETKYVGSDNDLFRINIYTNDKSTPKNLGVYHEGYITLTEQNTNIIIKNNMSMKIKVRGNSTSAPDKKPYKIKFDTAQSFFGLEADKDWILLANYFDKTNIRNYLAYRLAGMLDNLEYQPSYIFVDVYLNDNYQGLYMLTEQVEAGKGRVDIKDNVSENGISSFLLEVDARAVDEYSGYEGICYFNIGKYNMAMKYPDADDYIEALKTNNTSYIDEYTKNVEWVIDFVAKANNALLDNDYIKIGKYFNIDSFIDYYIVQEFFKNVDVGSTSQYYVIDQNEQKIKCGPVWDFDISAGVVDDSVSQIYTFYTQQTLYVKSVDYFYSMLLNNELFLKKLKERYKEIRVLLIDTIEEIEILKNDLAKAQIRNLNKWELPTERRYWIESYAMSNTYYNIKDLDGHYAHLTKTLYERLNILDKYYNL